MRSKLIYAAAAPAAMAAAALVAACGGSSPSSSSSSTPASSPSPTAVAASQVLPKMEAAVKAAKSVHMSGKAPNGSQHVTFDVSFFGKSGVAGSVGENGESFYILSESGRTFIKINAGFLKVAHAPASACATVCGKYVELPASRGEADHRVLHPPRAGQPGLQQAAECRQRCGDVHAGHGRRPAGSAVDQGQDHRQRGGDRDALSPGDFR